MPTRVRAYVPEGFDSSPARFEPLLDIVRKLKNYGDRAAILEYITRKVYAS